MISKWIQIEFANPKIKAIEHIQDIRQAANNAGLNLYSRFDVQLQYPMPTEDNRVIVELRIPDNKEPFAIGNHLRGIAKYMLSPNCSFPYEAYKIGNRLLNYIEVPPGKSTEKESETIEDIEAIIAFAKLLERTDDEARSKVSKIFEIINHKD